ncbi:hypothetical protein BCR43DRAFT_519116 [Syncephalastrum racemosum]|uniref:Uncharacterized protein n=1 Tax=Syncephalastrum racemosum TaxID=13706 RepID=A0A1X2GZ85_SYNRA|nr:hypothetical protein BCR43DRAFT_519116 [Syncephalastrum racemosum]
MGAAKKSSPAPPTSAIRHSPLAIATNAKKKLPSNFIPKLQRDFRSHKSALTCPKCARQGNWEIQLNQDKSTEPPAPTFSCRTCPAKPTYVEVRKQLNDLLEQEPPQSQQPQPQPQAEQPAPQQQQQRPEPQQQQQQQQQQRPLAEAFAHFEGLPDVISEIIRRVDDHSALHAEHAKITREVLALQQRNAQLLEENEQLRLQLAAARAQNQAPVLDEDMSSRPATPVRENRPSLPADWRDRPSAKSKHAPPNPANKDNLDFPSLTTSPAPANNGKKG